MTQILSQGEFIAHHPTLVGEVGCILLDNLIQDSL